MRPVVSLRDPEVAELALQSARKNGGTLVQASSLTFTETRFQTTPSGETDRVKGAPSMRVMPYALVISAVLFAGASPAVADEKADEAAVYDALQEFATALNAGDATAMAAFFDQDAFVTRAEGEKLQGPAAIEKAFAAAFEGSMKGARVSLTNEGVRFLRPDVAVMCEDYLMQGVVDGDGKELPTKVSHSLTVWVKRDGKWLIAALQAWVPLEDAR